MPEPADNPSEASLRIERLGHRGEGVATVDGRAVFVPFTLTGETVLVAGEGERRELRSVVMASPDRVQPVCGLFGRCGGCALQHFEQAPLLAWKRGRVLDALAAAGIEAEVAPCIDAHGQGRRRVTFHMRRLDGAWRAGFMAGRSHSLVPVTACPILVPALANAADLAETLTTPLARRSRTLDVAVTATRAGLDVDIRGHGRLAMREREILTDLATRLDVARLSIHGEMLAERRPPVIAMGEARVVPPPGAFLQATAEGEATLARLVADALSGQPRIIDLFAGCGTFTLRLARQARVHAVDSDTVALSALQAASRRMTGLKPVTVETRDLFRRPPLAGELADAAVVFDPPRAGAEAVSRVLAASKVRVVAAVSCNPATFARDGALLVAGGFRLGKVTPVDQFRYSSHVEIVAMFRR